LEDRHPSNLQKAFFIGPQPHQLQTNAWLVETRRLGGRSKAEHPGFGFQANQPDWSQDQVRIEQRRWSSKASEGSSFAINRSEKTPLTRARSKGPDGAARFI
jgi:hypothetical protein